MEQDEKRLRKEQNCEAESRNEWVDTRAVMSSEGHLGTIFNGEEYGI